MPQVLKRLLPDKAIAILRHLKNTADRAALTVFATNGFTASLYYWLFSRRFDREHLATLNGRKAYWRSLQTPTRSSAMLRRNIHRLEKGLIMRPRRSFFAEDYIGETVERYVQCLSGGSLDANEGQWAEHVLQEYFAVVTDTPRIKIARTLFEAHTPCRLRSGTRSVPYKYEQIDRSNVSFEQFKQLCVQRRSVRWFAERRVPRELIEKALEAATQAPSACNRQPFKYFVFDTPADAQRIGSIPMGTAGFSSNFQCVLVVVGDLSAYPYERDRHVIYIDGALASMQLLLALETLGLSSCVINWPDIENLETRMSRELRLQPYERPLMLIAVGYPDQTGLIPFSQKKSPTQLIGELNT
jgi:nitroreductase